MPHLFEFMDLTWLPKSLRTTLREILEVGNSFPFRTYYDWIVAEVLAVAEAHAVEHIVELGAGTAPITRQLARNKKSNGIRLHVCDINPDVQEYRALEELFPEKVCPQLEPIDFAIPQSWPENTLLVLSATLHHIPADLRPKVLESLNRSAGTVMVFEPLRKSPLCMGFVLLSIFPAILLPLCRLARPGRLRRFVWCWLIPVGREKLSANLRVRRKTEMTFRRKKAGDRLNDRPPELSLIYGR